MSPLLPLGPAYVAAVLEAAGLEVKVVDLTFADSRRVEPDVVKRAILGLEPDAVGMSSLTCNVPGAYRLARALKGERGDLPIVLGGPHVSALPERTLEECPALDAVAVGEGEYSFRDFLAAFFSRGISDQMKGIRGIVFRNGNRIEGGREPVYIENVDELPLPARHLFNLKMYMESSKAFSSAGRPIASMVSSRGCPHHCVFCTRSNNGFRYRGRSADSVVSEMEKLRDLGFTEVQIVDDNFTESRQRVVEICRLIKERGLDLKFNLPNGVRVDRVDEELLSMMYDAGFYAMHLGVESGDDRVLKVINKGTNTEQIRNAIRVASKIGFELMLYIIVGLPGSTVESERNTLSFVREMQVPFTFSVCTPYPGSPLWETVKDKYRNVSWDRFDETKQEQPLYVPEGMTLEELEDSVRAATELQQETKQINE